MLGCHDAVRAVVPWCIRNQAREQLWYFCDWKPIAPIHKRRHGSKLAVLCPRGIARTARPGNTGAVVCKPLLDTGCYCTAHSFVWGALSGQALDGGDAAVPDKRVRVTMRTSPPT